MRKPYQLLFVLLGVLAIALPAAALAQDTEEMTNGMPEYRQFTSKASRLRTSDVNDPDTVWIGHIADKTWRPKDKFGNVLSEGSFPSIQTGGYGPYRIGRGDNRPGIGPGTHYNGVWDWDHFGDATAAQGSFAARAAENDTLQGWWPLARPFQSGDAVRVDDKLRPFYGLDYGNQGCYVINAGSSANVTDAAGVHKRTFGVTGYWHRDVGKNSQPLADTGAVIPGPNVEWKPITGGASAWCGLRAQGDATHIDPITGNAYNQTVLSYRGNNSYFQQGSQSITGTDQNFPGYGSQWDQMLYQDVVLTSNASVTVQFDYATAMSRVRGGSSTQRIGYFMKDPTKPVGNNDGNFISATDAEATLGGPVDSFMVYVGKPVNDASCRLAGDPINPVAVYDPQRRWFSEVLALDTSGGLSQITELASVAGVTGTMAGDGTITPVHASLSLNTAQLTAMGVTSGGGTVRLVFRVKTNRGSDDEDYGAARAFTSGTRGAAVIDNVSVTQGGGNLVTNGDFENTSSIDNNTATPATSAWKSTGKPPGVYVHVHSIDPSLGSLAAPWNDPCSTPNFADPSAANRGCNMISNVLTGGDHDNLEKPGGLFGSPTQDRARWCASPTINLKSTGAGDYNGEGIDAGIAGGATDWALIWDYHSPGFRGNVNGNFFSIGMQSYPARQANGLTVWGETRHALTIFFQSVQGCFTTNFSPKTAGLVLTSNANGLPDSIRVYFQFLSRCFTFSHDANTCSPVSPSVLTGNHVDNLSFALIHVAPPAGLSVSPWYKYSDAFPATTTTSFASANFDTCAAWVKGGFNAHVANIGLTKPSIQGDSAWVQTGVVPGIRVDMVFRILPGVGNYVQIGNRLSGIRRVPTAVAPSVKADASNTGLTATQRFWGAYMADNGAFGTGGNGVTGPGHPVDGLWDPNRWNSARMDTLESNIFPCVNISPNLPVLDPSQWQTTYHESDPKYTILGLAKNRCFVVDPSLGRGTACSSKTTTSVTQCNMICGSHPVSAVYPPLWTQDLTSGLPATENGLPNGRTYEYTKIIPDGLLTPGAHVQYFYRRSPGAAAAVDYLPDTNFVFNAFTDGARWYHFSVLPDRWKDPAFNAGGTGMACMIVDDVSDRNFDEFFWVSVADSIGLTTTNKRGAHNGWHARGDQGVELNADNGSIGGNDSIARRDNGGQPGSLWDLWNTTAGESQTTGAAWLSNRSAAQPAVGELTEGKGTRTGPTGDMLRNFYRTMVFLTGSITTNFFGRIPNRTDDDMAMLNDFAAIPTGTAQPRSVFVYGSGFCEDLVNPGGPTGGVAFLNSYFGSGLVNGVYRSFSGNPKQVSNFDPVSASALDVAGGGFGLSGMKFGLSDGCGLENDVLSVNVAVPTAVAQARHENVGASGPYVASVYAPNGGTRLHISYLDGTRIQRIGGIISYNAVSGAPVLPLSNAGLRAYMFKALSIVAGSLGCGPQGAPVGVGDNGSAGNGSMFVDFMNLKSANPMRSGEARIAFGVAKTERVKISVYDVTGRLVKTVADRTFVGGQQHIVTWDGTSDAGGKVSSGVYFYQLKTSTWVSQKKLAVLAK